MPSRTGDVHSSRIIDWDQRRWYQVTGSAQFLPPEEDKEIDILKRHIHHLSQSAHTITVDDNGLLASVSSKAEDDPTMIPCYPRYSDAPSLQDCLTIRLSSLTELDRFGPGVDLMSVDKAATRKVVFKYTMIFQRSLKIWREIHLTKSLRHPNIVPLDHVVIDDIESRILGFTTPYISGGTLDQNRERVFRIEWLQQLTAVVDYLNLELGVVHQDIAPRNILIDTSTNKLQLFDFDWADPIGQADPQRNDIKGVIFTLYKIITEDLHFREVPYWEQDEQQVQVLEKWPVRCQLDSDIAQFRDHLNDWVRRRTTDAKHGPDQVKGPDTPDMPPPSPFISGYGENGEPYFTNFVRRRPDVLKQKKNVVIWERPPQIVEELPPLDAS